MISDLWGKIRFVCGNHVYENECAPVFMVLHEPASSKISAGIYGRQTSMFYSCPKYYEAERSYGESCCRNHISVREAETAVDYLSRILEKSFEENTEINLSGIKWKSRTGVEYKVLRHTDKHIDIICLNRKAIWK